MKAEITTHKKTNGVKIYTLWSWNRYDKSDKNILCMSSDYNKITEYQQNNNMKRIYLYDYQK